MVVASICERCIGPEIFVSVSHLRFKFRNYMVSNNINHHPDVFSVASVHESLQVIFGSKSVVNVVNISCPIAVVSTIVIVNNGRYPNSIKSHVLYVIKIVDYALIVTTTVVV